MHKVAEYTVTRTQAEELLKMYGIATEIAKKGGIAANQVVPAEVYACITKQASYTLHSLDGSTHSVTKKHTQYIPLVGNPAELVIVKTAELKSHQFGSFVSRHEMTEPMQIVKTIDTPLGREFFGLGMHTHTKVAGLHDKTGKVKELRIYQTKQGAFLLVPKTWEFTLEKTASPVRADETISMLNGQFIVNTGKDLLKLNEEKVRIKLASYGIVGELADNAVNRLKEGAKLLIKHAQNEQAHKPVKPLAMIAPQLKKIALQLSKLPEDVSNIAIELSNIKLEPETLAKTISKIQEILGEFIIIYWDALLKDGEPDNIDIESLRNAIIELDKVNNELSKQVSLARGGA